MRCLARVASSALTLSRRFPVVTPPPPPAAVEILDAIGEMPVAVHAAGNHNSFLKLIPTPRYSDGIEPSHPLFKKIHAEAVKEKLTVSFNGGKPGETTFHMNVSAVVRVMDAYSAHLIQRLPREQNGVVVFPFTIGCGELLNSNYHLAIRTAEAASLGLEPNMDTSGAILFREAGRPQGSLFHLFTSELFRGPLAHAFDRYILHANKALISSFNEEPGHEMQKVSALQAQVEYELLRGYPGLASAALAQFEHYLKTVYHGKRANLLDVFWGKELNVLRAQVVAHNYFLNGNPNVWPEGARDLEMPRLG